MANKTNAKQVNGYSVHQMYPHQSIESSTSSHTTPTSNRLQSSTFQWIVCAHVWRKVKGVKEMDKAANIEFRNRQSIRSVRGEGYLDTRGYTVGGYLYIFFFGLEGHHHFVVITFAVFGYIFQ